MEELIQIAPTAADFANAHSTPPMDVEQAKSGSMPVRDSPLDFPGVVRPMNASPCFLQGVSMILRAAGL
jgi:hypothetical protein